MVNLLLKTAHRSHRKVFGAPGEGAVFSGFFRFQARLGMMYIDIENCDSKGVLHMSAHTLEQRGKELENLFFAKLDAKRIEKMKLELKSEEEREALSKVTGITDDGVLEDMQQIGITSETLTAFSLVPLVAVAWADGTLDGREREAILAVVSDEGIEKESTAFHLLEGWLEKKPGGDVYRVWKEYVRALRQSLRAEALSRVKTKVLGRAQKVAEASGGFLGMGNKVSGEEARVLESLEKAFQ